MDLRKLKDKAAEAFTKGKFAKAAELYEQYCAKDDRDHQARLRMGDAWSKSGQKEKAIQAYSRAAEGFAKDGFLPRAIAASKLILELDPSHQGTQQILADLYAQRGGPVPGQGKGGAAKKSAPSAGEAAVALAMQGSVTAPTSNPRAIPLDIEEEPAPAFEPPAPPPSRAPAPAPAPLERTGGVDLSGELPPELSTSLPPTPPRPAALVPPAPSSASASSPPTPSSTGPSVVAPTANTSSAATPPSPLGASVVVSAPAPAAGAASGAAPGAPGGPPGLRKKTEPTPPAPSPAPAARTGGLGELQDALSRFDELSLDDAPMPSRAGGAGFAPPPPLQPQAGSLLHAVEQVALDARAAQGGAPADAEVEEVLDIEMDASPAPSGLPRIPLFSDLAPAAFIELFERGPLLRRAEGEPIFTQGSRGDGFFVVCAGRVRVIREDGGQRRELATLDEGAFFGEMALLSGAPRSATVESASEDTQLLEISASLLADLTQRYPQVAEALKKFCRQRLLSNVMATSALFQPFSRSDRRALVQRFRARDVPAGTTLVAEGKSSDGLYIVLSGEVEVVVSGRPVARLKEGELFGEMSLLERKPATGTVRATSRASLLRLPKEDFHELISSHPQVLMLIAELSDERRRKNEGVLPSGGEGTLLV